MNAIIEVIEGRDGDYRSDGNGCDDYPSWRMWTAWIVKICVDGRYSWGPVRFDEKTIKNHSGIATIQVKNTEIFVDKIPAENLAIETATLLERKGFKVDLVFKTDCSSQHLGTSVRWPDVGEPKNWIRRRLKPKIEELVPC